MEVYLESEDVQNGNRVLLLVLFRNDVVDLLDQPAEQTRVQRLGNRVPFYRIRI